MQEIKKLDDAHLMRLQGLEKQIGCCVVALESRPRLANLSSTQLKELQAMEKEMNAILLAYDCKPG